MSPITLSHPRERATHRLPERTPVSHVPAAVGHSEATGEATRHALPGTHAVGCEATDTQISLCCSGSLSLCDSNPRTPHDSASQGLLVALLDHRRRRGRVDLRGFELRMPEKLLDLL